DHRRPGAQVALRLPQRPRQLPAAPRHGSAQEGADYRGRGREGRGPAVPQGQRDAAGGPRPAQKAEARRRPGQRRPHAGGEEGAPRPPPLAEPPPPAGATKRGPPPPPAPGRKRPSQTEGWERTRTKPPPPPPQTQGGPPPPRPAPFFSHPARRAPP